LSLFGLGEPDAKEKKRTTLAKNVRRGKDAEDQFVWQEFLKGSEVERTGRGSDYKVKERSVYTGEAKKSYNAEIKSSTTARLSSLQKKSRAKKVVVKPLFDW
jgi:hypothetical protein